MNKKRHLSLLLMICVILLFGCAGKEKEADPWEDENYFETRVEEQEEQEKERKAKEAVAAASDGSWFMDHGLKFTSTGKGYVYDASLIKDKVDVKDINVAAGGEIMEDTDDCEDGYKHVTGLFIVDYSDETDDGSYPMMWLSAFDRKSGTSFESADGKHITIENEGGSFDISCEFKSSLVYPRLIRQCTVTCPKDYDGTVFQLGYASMALRDENEKLDYSSQLYKVDELPYFDNGHTYRYFALGEKGTPSMGEKVVQDAIDAYNGDNEDKGLEWGEGSSPWNHLPESDEQED